MHIKTVDSLAVYECTLTYFNPSTKNPIECFYEFPLERATVIGHMKFKIGDKEIEAVVEKVEEAKEKYDDAVAGGNAAVYGKRQKVSQRIDKLEIAIGNLLP